MKKPNLRMTVASMALVLIATASALLWQSRHSGSVFISGTVEAQTPSFFILQVPAERRAETLSHFQAECRGDKPARSFLQYLHQTLGDAKALECPVQAGHFSIRLPRGLHVFQPVLGKGFEDLRLVDVDTGKSLDFSKSIFKLSLTHLY